ncbi:transposase [Saprospira grandis]|uniref:transposase n=1 Tax=Saprospira grandis TaxID=1008 RepID=UPI00209FE6B2|nr:transposase [Saprospira grandis]
MARKTKAPLWQIVKAIIYRLKTGCQWRELPIKSFFDKALIYWQTVYYYFNSWSESGIWQKVWIQFLAHEKSCLDLSSIQLDGSHTPAKRGGEAVGYQGRKKSKTTNALFLTDKNGLPIAMSPPFAGNHNDLFEIESHFQKMLADLQLSDISPDGLFMNADAGFDSKKLRENCQKNGHYP